MSDSRWAVELLDEASRQLERLDPAIAERITDKLGWLRDHAEDGEHRPLRGALAGLFKLRVGDWRAIYEINADRRFWSCTP
ncbi:MAG TPA: type II toxin-antitoxin system RelE/ParE family toxin [Thermoanaerobaculia bacterium]|jgi:mRNA interferase RelE/StbE|nr:type II toxin-antitoxin system RelE/ParE family toxin [Thermoanaerobaculia bacterium]